MIIRGAAAADQGTIRTTVRGARLYPFDLHWQHFLVAELDGEIVGVGQIRRHGDGCRELASLAVLPQYHGHGIGGSLVNALLEQSARPLYLMCEGELTTYYVRFGFREIDPANAPGPLRRKAQFGNRLLRLFARFRRQAAGQRVAVMQLSAPG